MKIKNENTKIFTDHTLRETVTHGTSDFPFEYYYEDVFDFDFHIIDWHWHPEIELVYAESGNADFLIGNKRYHLREGMAIFINASIIHRFESSESAIVPNIVFSPTLLSNEDSLIYKKFIQPILYSSSDCFIFSPDISWQKEIIDILKDVFEIQESEKVNEIKTTSLLMKLWSTLYENVEINKLNSLSEKDSINQAKLQVMMQYIHYNFSSYISLDDIAEAVLLSKSSALNIFKKYLNTTPVTYLINYRLKQAAKLLSTSDSSVISIAELTGFENVGYFCRQFKKLFNKTPSEYRKKLTI